MVYPAGTLWMDGFWRDDEKPFNMTVNNVNWSRNV